jgi:hypothetical protein
MTMTSAVSASNKAVLTASAMVATASRAVMITETEADVFMGIYLQETQRK